MMTLQFPFSRLVLASNNAGKLKEFSGLLAPYGVEVLPQAVLQISEAEEPYPTFIENALTKARHASRASGLPALADDSGLCVQALDGAPGVYSARYAQRAGGEKSDTANNAHLLEQLAGRTDRQACYVAVLALVRHAEDPLPLVAQGLWQGEIAETPRGTHGFGYDPLFSLASEGCTAAELEPGRKNQISHRALAWQQLLAQLGQTA